jgi:hypothetical protein
VHSLVYQALSHAAPALLVKHRVNVIDRVAGVIEELRTNHRDVLNRVGL